MMPVRRVRFCCRPPAFSHRTTSAGFCSATSRSEPATYHWPGTTTASHVHWIQTTPRSRRSSRIHRMRFQVPRPAERRRGACATLSPMRVLAATLAATVVLVGGQASAAFAAQPGVHVDPGSPAGKQYAIPISSARSETAGQTGSNVGDNPPAFGVGITPPPKALARHHRSRISTRKAGSAPSSKRAGTNAGGGNRGSPRHPRQRRAHSKRRRPRQRLARTVSRRHAGVVDRRGRRPVLRRRLS